MSARNYYVRNEDENVLKVLAEEYESMGRDTKIEGNTLTVYALKQKVVKPKKTERPKRRVDRDDDR